MTDRDALLRSIIESPQDDLPRLVYADWLDENGNSAHAAFIRCQIELARLDVSDWRRSIGKREALRRREVKLWDGLWDQWLESFRWDYPADGKYDQTKRGSPHLTDMSRGFVSSLTLSWSDWLRHHEAIYWHAEQTVECEACGGTGSSSLPKMYATELRCRECEADDPKRGLVGTGRIPRPFVATAQPLERVVITGDQLVYNRYGDHWFAIDGHRFDRMTCSDCDGWGTLRATTFGNIGEACLTCRGQPINSWRCETWPTITFVMPEAERAEWAGDEPLNYAAIDAVRRHIATEPTA